MKTRVKTIARRKSWPKWARWLSTDRLGKCLWHGKPRFDPHDAYYEYPFVTKTQELDARPYRTSELRRIQPSRPARAGRK